MPEVRFPRDAATVKEFEHPGGDTGIMIGLSLTGSELAERYDIEGVVDETTTVMPLKHKADGATNFDSYREEDGELVVVHSDDDYDQIRDYLLSQL